MELNKIYNMDCLKGMREMPDIVSSYDNIKAARKWAKEN